MMDDMDAVDNMDVVDKMGVVDKYFLDSRLRGNDRPHPSALILHPYILTSRRPYSSSLRLLYIALSGLRFLFAWIPRALPWAIISCPFGANKEIKYKQDYQIIRLKIIRF